MAKLAQPFPGNRIITQTEYLYHRKLSCAAGNRIPSTAMFNTQVHVTFSDFPARGPVRGRGFPVPSLKFKRFRVGVLSMFHIAVTVAVGNLKKGGCLSQFPFKVLSLVRIYPGRPPVRFC